jgi:hypothetical protein
MKENFLDDKEECVEYWQKCPSESHDQYPCLWNDLLERTGNSSLLMDLGAIRKIMITRKKAFQLFYEFENDERQNKKF